MQITKDFFERLTPPDFVLCKANKERIGTIFCTSKKYDERNFEDIDSMSFTTPLYLDNGEQNPYYDLIVVMKYIYVIGIGLFYIDSVKMTSEGTHDESKEVVIKGYEGLLAQKYLENFAINVEADITDEDPVTGEITYGSNAEGSINDVTFYNPYDTQHSLLNLVLEKCPEWSVGHVDKSLWDNGAQYQVDRQDILSFLKDTVKDKTKCFFIFNTVNMTINAYDADIYGKDTHVYANYQNLLQQVNMNCNVSDIKTCLTVKGSEDMNLAEINFGHMALYNLDYFHTTEYMSQQLYDDYAAWKKKYAEALPQYTQLLKEQIQVEQQIIDLNTKFPTIQDIANPKEDYYKWAFDDKYDEETIKKYLSLYGYDDTLDDKSQSNTSPLGTIYNAISSIQQAQRIKSENQDALTEEQKEQLSKVAVKFDESGKIHYTLVKTEDVEKNKQENQQKQKDYQKDINAEYEKLHNLGLDKYKSDIQADTIQHKFGNVNMDMRTRLEWTQNNQLLYQDELASWNYKPAYTDWSTVLGKSAQWTLNKKTITIAYSPIFVDKKGKNPRLLSKATVNGYIQTILTKTETAIKETTNTQWTNEKIYAKVLELDRQGWTVDKYNSHGAKVDTIFVHDIIACIDTWTGIQPYPANDVAELIHFVGYYGVLNQIPQPSLQTLYIIDEKIAEKINHILQWTQEQIDVVSQQLSELRERDAQLMKEKSILADEVAIENNLSHEEWKELSPFIREDQFQSEDYCITDHMTEEEREEMMQALQKVAQEELLKKSTPQLTFDASLVNLFDLPEFKDCYENFDVGNYIHVQLRDDFEVKARVIKISFDYYNPTDFTITFSNVLSKEKNIFTDIQDAINNANSAATSLSYGSGAWAKAARESKNVNKLLSDGLIDAGQYLKSTTDVSEMKIDERGIFINTRPSDEDEQTDSIYIGGGRILFSDDKWTTVREAIGRVNIDGESIFGVIADAVVAGSVYGSTLKGNEVVGGTVQSDDYESGKKGSFLNLTNGTFEFNQNGQTLLSLTDKGLKIGGYVSNDDLSTETQAYQKAIQDEKTARENADKANSEAISNEATARDKAISDSYNTLNGKITDVDGKFATYTTTKALAEWLSGSEQTQLTSIQGGLIKTGFITSEKGQSWIDLDNGTFNFGGGNGAGKNNTNAQGFIAWNGNKLTLKGELSSPTGKIGGFSIGANNFAYTNPSNANQYIELGNSGIRLGKGNTALGGYNFSVDISGNVKAGNMTCLSLQGSNITGQCGYSLSSDGHTRHDFGRQAVLKLGDAMITPYWIHQVNAALFGGDEDPFIYG